MGMRKSAVDKLCEGFAQLSTDGNLQECLGRLSGLAADIVGARECVILLLNEDNLAGAGLGDEACFGPLPKELGGHPDGPLSGTPKRPPAPPGQARRDAMISAIVVHGKTVGVIHVCGPVQRRDFSEHDLDAFSVLTPLVARSIQVIQLQNILKSRFAQIALSKTDESMVGDLTAGVIDHPNRIARILAKSFYREMLNAGFNFSQILSAATEVISELTTGLRKHSARHKERGTRDIMEFSLPNPAALAALEHRPGRNGSGMAAHVHAE